MIKSLRQYFLLLIVMAIAMASCGYDDVVTDRVEGVNVESFDNSGELPKKIGDGKCNRMAYLLWVSFSLGDNADVAHLAQPMTDLRIVTLGDFDAGHQAGSDVTELFALHPIRPEISMTDYDTNNYEAVRFSMPSAQHKLDTIYREGAYFMLITPPEPGQQCQFRVEVRFADGSTMQATGDVVTFE
ncbi:MAG: DUF5034 domain-containing protein [Muribaculaceae bacterium]